MSEAGRPRYRGEAQALADVCLPHALTPGWFKYSEQDIKGSLKPAVLKSHKILFNDLKGLQDNMCFSKGDMTRAMIVVLKNKLLAWGIDGEQAKEQTRVMFQRLRVACRHISQAGRKKNPPKLYMELFEFQGEREENKDMEDSHNPMEGKLSKAILVKNEEK